MHLRYAEKSDARNILAFIEKAGVDSEGIKEQIQHFVLMEDKQGNLQGTLGIYKLGDKGLLRSLVMSEKVSQEEILALFHEAFRLAWQKELKDLYLVTNKSSALPFFHLLGFQEVAPVSSPSAFQRFYQEAVEENEEIHFMHYNVKKEA
ncbi:GNAT family N-acetyltransferase [Priestia filamentosa]|uniref:GNAT family N-acetyltransferase n=1 Tax=Priestia filamentosa TaxID=1402861 RepID=UPI0002FC6642|nr:hypothetical protein [Priestia filamentosa]RJS66092.1 hypothetical protein CJ485_15775 [Priestia filamentosa]WCM15704.1 hypothetical protein PGN40_20730 [Priestia filamentosa]